MTNHPKPLMGKPEEFTAGEPSKTEEFNSPTPADELNYDAAFRATDSTTAVASYQDCSGSAAPLEPNRGWDDAEQGLMPTPADEEVAREIVRGWVTRWFGVEPNEDLIKRITTALAEARRAGTPTTDARREQAKAIVREWLSDKTVNMLTRFTADDNFVTEPLINAIASAFSSTPGDDDYVAWCHYVNHGTDDSGADVLTIETCDSDAKGAFKVYGHATPSDEVAQRTRAAAEEIVASVSINDFRNIQSFNRYDRLTDVILKHFTATDVEQGTCTWTCEPNLDIEMRETDCGNAFQFEVGGPTENKMKFCCYCGKPLVEAAKES